MIQAKGWTESLRTEMDVRHEQETGTNHKDPQFLAGWRAKWKQPRAGHWLWKQKNSLYLEQTMAAIAWKTKSDSVGYIDWTHSTTLQAL